MKINEELYLKSTILQIRKYSTVNETMDLFYENLESLDIKSLQDLSFNNDLKFFDEINFILSVIISIVVHPHISNTRERIILRSDQVGSLQNDMFLETMKDASLWKHNKDKEMIPEYVHYHQTIDEIRIYENIFVVMLIDLLADELVKYNEFYSKMILTYDGSLNLSSSNDKVQVAFERIEILLKKIRKIKKTYFYKAISKGGKTKLNHITPTNILLKDRLYNFCFKFYRKNISYEDEANLSYDFNTYYYVLLLRSLKENNFSLISGKEKKVLKNKEFVFTNKLTFANDNFIAISEFDNENNSIILSFKNKANKNNVYTHLLSFDSKSTNDEILKSNFVDLKKYNSVEIVSLWDRKYFDNQQIITIKQNIVSEQELLNQYLKDHLMLFKGSRKIYSQYCPVCKSKTINSLDDDLLQCSNCHSSYVFVSKGEGDESMWIIKLKR